MKRILFLFLLVASALHADVATIPSSLSSGDLAAWAITGGHLGSGTGALPAVGPVGSRYTDLTNPAAPVEYRSNGIAWIAISGGGSGGPDDDSAYQPIASMGFYQLSASMTDYLLANTAATEYVGSAAFATEHNARIASEQAISASIPVNASFTLSGLSEKDYSSLTGRPTSASWTHDSLSGVSNSAHGTTGIASTAAIPNNASFSANGLSDFPSRVGNSLKTLRVNAGESGYEWATSGGTWIGSATTNLDMPDGTYVQLATGGSAIGSLSLRFRSDPDTGFMSPWSNSIAAYAGGLRSMLIDSSTGNTTLGYRAGEQISGGNYNVCIGQLAGRGITTGNRVVFVGNSAGISPNTSNSVFVGDSSQAQGNTANNDSVSIGYRSGYYNGLSAATSQNVFIGKDAGYWNIGGVNSVQIGFQSGYTGQTSWPNGQATATTNSISIGAYTYNNESNQVVIGDSNINDFQVGQGGSLARIATSQTTLPGKIVASASYGYVLQHIKDPDSGIYCANDNDWYLQAGGATSGRWNAGGLTSMTNVYSHNADYGYGMITTRMPSSTQPAFTFSQTNLKDGFGRANEGMPNVIASGTEAQRWTAASGTTIVTNTLVTPEGGTAIRMTATGTALTRGDIVQIDHLSPTRCCSKTDADDLRPIGAIWGGVDGNTTVNNGSEAWVVTDGVGYVNIDATPATVPGGVLLTSATAGKAAWTNGDPNSTDHWKELGHNLASGTANSTILAIVHFN